MLSMVDTYYIDNTYGICKNTGENQFLSDVMTIIRSKRPLIKNDLHFTLSILENRIAQVWIQTPPCRYSQMGRCTICNYWKGKHISNVLDELMQDCVIPEDCDAILINTCGSCLDAYELSLSNQEKLWDWINKQYCKVVILETHADTLTPDRISHIRERIPNKDLYFEIGIESVSRDVLLYCLNKHIPDIPIKKLIDYVHAFDVKLIANVVLGAPFLTQEEQVQDTINSIHALMKMGVEYVTLFPINLKPYTLTKLMYENGLYELVTGNMIIDVLSGVSPEYLPQVDVAWYGDRLEEGLVAPYYCSKCQKHLVQMIGSYNKAVSKEERQRGLERIKTEKCICRCEVNHFYDMAFSKRIEYGYKRIKEWIIKFKEDMN